MPRELDPFRKYVKFDENKNWNCEFCGNKYAGGATRIRAHLAGSPRFGIKGCERVNGQVKAEALKAISVKGDTSTGGISGEGTEKIVSGASQMVFRSNYASNPNDMLNSNQAGCAPEQPSCYRQTGTGNASASPQYHVSFPPGNMPLENLGTTQQPDLSKHRLDAALGNEMLSSPQQLLMDTSSLHPSEQPALLGQPTHLETGSEQQNSTGLSSSPNDQVLGNSMSNGLQELIGGDMLLDSPYPFEIMQMNEPHNPTGGSPLQRDVDSTNRLQDCSQPRVAEVVPVPSYTSPTNTVQHPDQLPPTCNKEYGNETRSFPSKTPIKINPPMASEHRSDSYIFEATNVDLQVPDAATNATGPSSSQDMNIQSIYANDEEIRNLKRKVEELDHKEAVIKEQMEIESAASSVRKKPRILVEEWLKETEKARNTFQIIDNAGTCPPKEQVKTLTRQLKELTEQTLPETLLIQVRGANEDEFLERKLIGEAIHRNIKLIWDRLKEDHVCKLGICGMGGVGKTTIMMHIHNRLLKDATFDGVLFITVSQDFSIYKLQSDIWKELKFGVMEDEHEKKRAAKLSEHLERKKKCVLILDDVWQHFKLQDVGIPDRVGLKVVLTTRFSEVCSRMDCEEIKIQPLGEEEAWKLFVEEIGPKPLANIRVEEVARKIANRCAGLPLAINTMGSSLRGQKKFSVWQDTLNRLERSHTKHTEMGDKILPVLILTYEHLSDPQVKQCFLSCALFPHESAREMTLIEFFIDEGFLDELDTREAQYYRGLAIVDMLQDACLLEFRYGDMVMHDLIREMALHIMSTTCMVKAGQGLQRIPDGEYWTKDLEKVSLMDNYIDDIPPDMSPNCPKLSTLLVISAISRKHMGLPDSCRSMQIQDSFFMNLRGLKVLNLSGCVIRELPNSLSELANLRALLLRNCSLLHRVPYLGKLKSLRKLDVSGCSSLLAVEGLEELRNLRYLDLKGTGIKTLSEGTLRRMENLQYLKLAGNVKAEEVIQLKALERLECKFGNVDDFNKYVTFMEGRGCRYYKLVVVPEESFWFISACVYFDREFMPDDDEDFSNRSKCVEIRSGNYAMVRVGEQRNNDSILIPGDVESFEWGNCGGMTNSSVVDLLRCLRKLVITEWDNSGALFGGAGVDEEEVRNTRDSPAPLFPFLERLEIYGCSKLKYLFGHEFIFSLPLLREVVIGGCEGIEGMTTSIAPPPQLGGPAFPRLEHIEVHMCGNMKRVVESEWLPHFPNLTRIEVLYCNNIKELLPHECLLHLPNLKHILVWGCEGIEEIIRGGGENHGGSAPPNTPSSSLPSPFSPLKSMTLSLRNLPQLKSIGEGALSFIPGASVKVLDCPKLRSVRPPSVQLNYKVLWNP